MNKIKIISLIVLTFLVATSQAQLGKVWYFGFNSGIDFRSGTAVPLSGGQTQNFEGNTVVLDKNDSLLFYSDGRYIWNKNHQTMPDGAGLMGHTSSTTSGLIVPLPESDSLFYLFTSTSLTGSITYNVVDITLDNGLGDIIPGQKNIVIETNSSEKLAAIQHANKKDYWILTHNMTSKEIRSYLLTSTGLSLASVNNSIPISLSIADHAIGQIKGNLSGSQIAFACYDSDTAMVYEFDNSTGQLGNNIATLSSFNNGRVYGIEFSPNEQFLYIAEGTSPFGKLYQYDLNAGSSQDIGNSRVDVDTQVQALRGSLQLAPDGKIYYSRWNHNTIGIINSPNLAGLACDANMFGFVVPGMSQGGLAALPNNVFNRCMFISDKICLGNSNSFFYEADAVDSVLWDLGDGTTSMLDSFSHIYADTGQYLIELTMYSSILGEKTLIDSIRIYDSPDVDLGSNITRCTDTSFVLVAGEAGLNQEYEWSDNSTGLSLTVNQPGTYSVTVTNEGGCTADDEMEYIIPNLPSVDLGNDTTICIADTIDIYVEDQDLDLVWNNGSTENIIGVGASGIYIVRLTKENCTVSDTIEITVSSENGCEISLVLPNVFSPNDDSLNDYFIPVEQSRIAIVETTVYNRWGNLVFRSDEDELRWDGTLNNEGDHALSDGTYFYKVNYEDEGGNLYSQKGHVTLVR